MNQTLHHSQPQPARLSEWLYWLRQDRLFSRNRDQRPVIKEGSIIPAELFQVFTIIDENASNTIDIPCIISFLAKALDKKPNTQKLIQGLILDTHGVFTQDKTEFPEFYSFVDHAVKNKWESIVDAAFNILDCKHTGRIVAADIHAFCQRIDLRVSMLDIEACLYIFDPQKNPLTRESFNRFARMMLNLDGPHFRPQ